MSTTLGWINVAVLGVLLAGCGSAPQRAADSPKRNEAAHRSITNPHLALGLPVDADPSDDAILDRGQYDYGHSPGAAGGRTIRRSMRPQPS